MKNIVIIDYGCGNVESVANALRQISCDSQIILSNKTKDIESSTHLILPGVSAFGECMNGLQKFPNLIDDIKKAALLDKKPMLGICAGMQILSNIGYENGAHQGLALLPATVKKIEAGSLKLPQIGWNNLFVTKNHKILKDIQSGDHLYFANSYQVILEDENYCLAYVEYGLKIASIVAKDNIFGMQFHPEKSGKTGLQLLKNFLEI